MLKLINESYFSNQVAAAEFMRLMRDKFGYSTFNIMELNKGGCNLMFAAR